MAPHAFPRQHRYPCLVLGNIATRHFGLKPVGRSKPLRRPRPLASRLFTTPGELFQQEANEHRRQHQYKKRQFGFNKDSDLLYLIDSYDFLFTM